MTRGYVFETARWLCGVEAQGGGWGIEPNDDDSRKPISGEVAYALSQVAATDADSELKLKQLQGYFSVALDDPDQRSVVHLCWVVLGSMACRLLVGDSRMTALLDRLVGAHRDGGHGH